MSVYKKRVNCAICDGKDLHTILEYGEVPLAGFFPKKEELDSIPKYPLQLVVCGNCFLMQTDSVIDADHLFKDYRYLSSVSLQKHFNEYSKYLIKKFSLTENSRVLEIGSNDGVLQVPMLEAGIDVVGFEPSDNVSKMAIDKGCNVIKDYFNDETIKKYFSENSADLVTASNSFAHIDDIKSVVSGLHYVLKKDGHFIFEVHYGKNIIDGMQFDNVYHEHIYYYTIAALERLFDDHDMTIVDVEEISLHSGSIRVTVANNQLLYFLPFQEKPEFKTIKYYRNYSERVKNHCAEIANTISQLKTQGLSIAGYGASGRANLLCNYLNINEKLIDYIVDESPERYNRYINNIPIVNSDKLNPETDVILIFAWNYSKMIIKKLEDKGLKFKYLILFPTIRTVESYDEIKDDNTL